jgi:hypothetical protein
MSIIKDDGELQLQQPLVYKMCTYMVGMGQYRFAIHYLNVGSGTSLPSHSLTITAGFNMPSSNPSSKV